MDERFWRCLQALAASSGWLDSRHFEGGQKQFL